MPEIKEELKEELSNIQRFINIKDDENKDKIEEHLSNILKILKNDVQQRIEEYDKDIEFHEKSIKMLENLPQDSKKELEKKETELLNIIKKESLLAGKFYSLFIGFEDILSFIDSEDISSISEKKGKLQSEISTIAEELGLKDIIER